MCSSVLEAFQRVHDEAFKEGYEAGLSVANRDAQIAALKENPGNFKTPMFFAIVVEDFEFDTRITNALKRAGVHDAEELLKTPESQLRRILIGNDEWFKVVNAGLIKRLGLSVQRS